MTLSNLQFPKILMCISYTSSNSSLTCVNLRSETSSLQNFPQSDPLCPALTLSRSTMPPACVRWVLLHGPKKNLRVGSDSRDADRRLRSGKTGKLGIQLAGEDVTRGPLWSSGKYVYLKRVKKPSRSSSPADRKHMALPCVA